MGNYPKESINMNDQNAEVFKLSNGIKVAYQFKPTLVGHLGVMIQGGSRYEKEDEQGLAHFLEHCIFKGTKKRTALDIYNDLDSVGGELNAYTNKEEICVHASFRNIHLDVASELLSDIVSNATFPENEVEKEKDVVLDEINSYLDSPAERLFDEFEGHLFKGHALGYNTLGTKKTVKSFNQSFLIHYRDRYFVPDNMVLSYVGNAPMEEVQEILEQDFKRISGKVEKTENPFLPSRALFKLKEKKSNFQTHTVLGGWAPSYNDKDRHAMSLLINFLGGPALNSKLTLNIREKFGYAYNIEAGYTAYEDVGFWNVYVGTDKKFLKKAINLIYEELCFEMTQKELDGAKEQLKGHIALSLDSNLEVMFNMGKSIMLHEKLYDLNTVYSKIDKIALSDVNRLIKTFFEKENISQLTYVF